MRSLVFWSLFPFVVPQAIRIRRNAPRFAAAAGPNEGTVGTGRNLNLLAIGDSIIAGVGATHLSKALVGQTSLALAEALRCKITWSARGLVGARLENVLHDMGLRSSTTEADFIILCVGVNDITSLTTIPNWKRDLSKLLRLIAGQSPTAIIAVAGIPPLNGFPLLPQPMRALFGIRGRSFDEAARQVVSEFTQAVHVPVEFDPRPEKFAPDGYHPSEDGYREFGQGMADSILEKLR